MEKKYKQYLLISGLVLFVVYIFAAPQLVPPETALASLWVRSLVSTYPSSAENAGEPLPFKLGDRFGYVDKAGNFPINHRLESYVSLARDRWAEYSAVPGTITVQTPHNETLFTIKEAGGYPLFLDNKTFLINSEQNTLYAIDESGERKWSYAFASPIICADAAAGYLLTGSLDGTVEVLDENAKRVFFFEPGGSRLAVIVGCAISKDGTKIALISGIDEQRFLLMEKLGDALDNEYRVSYHEFLGQGFRRPVHITFVDNDNKVAFEREQGLGIYDISERSSLSLPVKGQILRIDDEGGDGLLFVITKETGEKKNLITVKFPNTVIGHSSFKTNDVFLSRQGNVLYVGGGSTLAAFEILRK